MQKENVILFRYLYNIKDANNNEKEFLEKINSDPEALELLKDFDIFLRVYHRYSQNCIESLFKEISMQIRYLSLKIMIDSAVDGISDEELIELFGESIYNYIYNFCTDIEYPNFRADKYATLYKKAYKSNIKFFLNDNH